jgi:hypothetical protein
MAVEAATHTSKSPQAYEEFRPKAEDAHSKSLFQSAFGACGCAVALTYLTILLHVFVLPEKLWDSENLGPLRIGESSVFGSRPRCFTEPISSQHSLGSPLCIVSLYVAVFLFWLAVPAISLKFGFSASCDTGAPDLAYVVYGAFALLHTVVALGICYSGDITLQPFFNKMDSLGILVALSFLEHFDIYTTAIFPGVAYACNESITPKWIESWKQASWGHSLAFVLEELQFGGLALTLYVAGVYIPQFLQLSPVATLVCFSLTFLGVLLWVMHSWWVGLAVLVCEHTLYWIIVWRFGTSWPELTVLPLTFRKGDMVAAYAGILIFKPSGNVSGKLLYITSVKLIFDNLLQLWIQSSEFVLSFEQIEDASKKKALLSMGLALMVAASKLIQLIALAVERFSDAPNKSVGLLDSLFLLLPVICFGLGPWLWTIAKIYYAYHCDSHVWNLSSGCVEF